MGARRQLTIGESIVTENKMFRFMQLIMVLKHEKLTAEQIADRLELKPRSAYRYINLLQSLNFEMECDFDNRYFITSDCPICGAAGEHSH